MDQTPWYLNSNTIRGAIVTLVPVLALIAKAFGADVGSDEQSKIVDGGVALVGLAGTVYVLISRIRAQKNIEQGK
jgi:hypothetical protein